MKKRLLKFGLMICACVGTAFAYSCSNDVSDIAKPQYASRADEVVNSQEFEQYQKVCTDWLNEFNKRFSKLSDEDKATVNNLNKELQVTSDPVRTEAIIAEIDNMLKGKVKQKRDNLINNRSKITELISSSNITTKELIIAVKKKQYIKVKSRESFEQYLCAMACMQDCENEGLVESLACSFSIILGPEAVLVCLNYVGLSVAKCKEACPEKC